MTTLLDFPYHGCEDLNFKRHIEKVIAGEYATFLTSFRGRPTILDIGGNIGSFAYWALKQYPNAQVVAFEPSKKNCQSFMKNMRDANIQPWSYTLIQSVVLDRDDKFATIYKSEVNDGMHSTYSSMTNTENPESFQAPIMKPQDLPDCQILKMDTEGCEVEILKAYLGSHTNIPDVISFEFHNFLDQLTLDDLLQNDYIIASGKIVSPALGTLNYVHKDVVEAYYRENNLSF